jgi:shikimate kinase
MNIVLIGYRCTGKTSVGRKISERLKIPFYDADELITEHTGKTVREIVDRGGWDLFRKEEKAIIRGLSFLADTVIAVGGGAVMDGENREALKRNGLFLWLTADVHTIIQRMRNDSTGEERCPPLASDCAEREISGILEQRIPIYRQLSDFTIDTSERDIDAIADEFCYLFTRRILLGERTSFRMT